MSAKHYKYMGNSALVYHHLFSTFVRITKKTPSMLSVPRDRSQAVKLQRNESTPRTFVRIEVVAVRLR